jgi:hypothetical protein
VKVYFIRSWFSRSGYEQIIEQLTQVLEPYKKDQVKLHSIASGDELYIIVMVDSE